MQKTLILIITTNLLTACSINPDAKLPTLRDQASLSGIIITGKVSKTVTSTPDSTSLEINKIIFLKGNLQNTETLTIKGFKNSSLCGSGILTPDLDKEYIFFLCEENLDGKIGYKIHDISLGNGYVENSKENKEVVQAEVGEDKVKGVCKDFDFSGFEGIRMFLEVLAAFLIF